MAYHSGFGARGSKFRTEAGLNPPSLFDDASGDCMAYQEDTQSQEAAFLVSGYTWLPNELWGSREVWAVLILQPQGYGEFLVCSCI